MKQAPLWILLAVFAIQPAFAQLLPQGSHVNLYFPQIADGGGYYKVQTSLTFLNPDTERSALVLLYLYRNDGSAFSVDFGSGAFSSFLYMIPPMGSKTIKSTGAPPEQQVGHAIAAATIPVQANAGYRLIKGGAPSLDINVYPSSPTIQYSSPATKTVGIGIANPNNHAISVNLDLWDANGIKLGGPVQVSLPALGHESFYAYHKFPPLPEFSGTLMISSNNPTSPWTDSFVAMTLSEDSENLIWSGLPAGALRWPQADTDRIWLVYNSVLNVVVKNGWLSWSPQLKILAGNEINARAYSDGSTIEITLGLSQLLSDSDAELAFAIGHELGHMMQLVYGELFWWNKELDADVWGLFLAMSAGYEPYGAAGALGRLEMASGSIGLIGQIFEDIVDPHTSFANRLDNLHLTIDTVCTTPEMQAVCINYKTLVHPNFPSGVKLMVKPTSIPKTTKPTDVPKTAKPTDVPMPVMPQE